MADELLDLVNDKDEIIGEVWKSEANTNPKIIHREIAVIIYNDKGQVLFQKRNKTKRVNPSIWTETVAGHIGKGEEPIDAAHRELIEEVGFDTELEFFDKVLAHMPKETHFIYFYTGKFPENAKIKIQEDEVEKVAFMSESELNNLVDSGEQYKPSELVGYSEDRVRKFWKQRS